MNDGVVHVGYAAVSWWLNKVENNLSVSRNGYSMCFSYRCGRGMDHLVKGAL